MLYSQVPTFFFILSGFKIISRNHAFTLSSATALLALFLFGTLYGKLLDYSFRKRMIIGMFNAMFGFIIILLNSLVH